MKRSRLAPALTAFVLLVLPAIALACPMCGGGGGDSPRSQAAFFNTTILLSLLPLGMIGGGVLWLRRDARDLQREFEERNDPRSAPPDLHVVEGADEDRELS